ncbi:MAG TPA: helix-hairpin-helix domain-containing protein [Actinophytocola sp.]|uniref:ComEA family DNA-binding protein n=1 Tax=Actinophytocola sp. TaxID=1872138 RepID=UPI002DDD1BA2|nr:helix-hairpin-helix domain-containing protein [Actinophytocola sp.]HEV2784639.1 helix-hairpin-helix domain-containing protein [Actinophytocola sp.]
MPDNTTRPDSPARDRLDRLIRAARAGRAGRVDDLPPDQQWIDEPAAEPGPVRQAPAPAADPWWRRGRAGRMVERWVPGGAPAGARRRVPVFLLAALVLGTAAGIGVALSSDGGPEPPPNLPAVAASPNPSAFEPSGAPGAGGTIVVSVVGRVVQPGLVTLPDGARVADAVRAAGGPAPGVDVSGLNIARRLSDGEQIYVGIPPPPDAQPAGPSAGGSDKIDLNTASVAQLDTLPGVGAVTAQRVVDWRLAHGRFTRVEQLREVDGIGPARFAKLKDLVVVR